MTTPGALNQVNDSALHDVRMNFKPQFDIAIESEGWPAEPELHERVGVILAVPDLLALPQWPISGEAMPPIEISFVFTDDSAIQQLNQQWRGQNKPTNVLSFMANEGLPQDRWSPLLGDVIIARETVAREAVEQSKPFDHHLTHLLVHGVLHLLGFDHLENDEAEAMENTERQVLAKLGIADPYDDA